MQPHRPYAMRLALAALLISMQSAYAAPERAHKWTPEGAQCVNEALEKKRSAIDSTTDCQQIVCKGLSGNAEKACAQELYAAAEKGEPIVAGKPKAKSEDKVKAKAEVKADAKPKTKPEARAKQVATSAKQAKAK